MAPFSESEEEDALWVPYAERPEFSDLPPIAQEDTADAPVSIAYSPRFSSTMGTLRALIAAGELSRRALRVTRGAIRENAADYTAWWYRRRVLDALDGCDGGPTGGEHWRAEFPFTEQVAEESPKNYQLWHHRRAAVTRVPSLAAGELAFTAAALAEDAKNYHVWAHRQWVVSEHALWDAELAFTERLIREDLRNNSAYCHRLFVLRRGASSPPSPSNSSAGGDPGPEPCAAEAAFVLPLVRRAPGNEAAWSYLTAIAHHDIARGAEGTGAAFGTAALEILAAARECHAENDQGHAREHAAACEVDLLEAMGRHAEAAETARAAAVAEGCTRPGWWCLRVTELEGAATAAETMAATTTCPT